MTTPIIHQIKRDPDGFYMVRFDGELFGPVETRHGPLSAAYTFLSQLGHLRIEKPLEGYYYPNGRDFSQAPVYEVYFSSMSFEIYRRCDIADVSSAIEAAVSRSGIVRGGRPRLEELIFGEEGAHASYH